MPRERQDIGPHTPLPLKRAVEVAKHDTPVPIRRACKLFFPDGEATPDILLKDYRDGRLPVCIIGNKILVTLSDVQKAVRLRHIWTEHGFWGVPGIIYVVGFGPYVKIGYTTGPIESRLKELQTGAPEPIAVYGRKFGTVQTERRLHTQFASSRLQGEWFRREGEIAAWIEAGCPL